MAQATNNPSHKSRRVLLLGIAGLAIVAVVYFSFFYPPTKNEDVTGTIGAAKKWRSEQITDKDVKLEGSAIASDEKAAELTKAADALHATVEILEKTPGTVDKSTLLQVSRAAEAATVAAKTYANRPKDGELEKRVDVDAVQKSIVAVNNAAKELLEKSSMPTVGKTALPTVGKTALPTVDKTALPTVDKTALPTVDKNAPPTVDKNALPTVDRNALPAVDKNAPPTVDKNTQTFDRNATLITLSSNAAVLERTVGVFSKTIEQYRFEKTQTVDKNFQVDKNASIDKTSKVVEKATTIDKSSKPD
jgi:hypothetical protein